MDRYLRAHSAGLLDDQDRRVCGGVQGRALHLLQGSLRGLDRGEPLRPGLRREDVEVLPGHLQLRLCGEDAPTSSSSRRPLGLVYSGPEPVPQVWGEVAADVMYQSFVQNYQNQPRYNEWRKVARIGRATDFRPQHRIKIGEYADLGAVTENLQYPDITHPGDEESTIKISKHGYIAPRITREMMYNDNIGALAEIPTKLAQAAARTLYKDIFIDIFESAYTYTVDTAALFASGTTRVNLGSDALTLEGLNKARIAMRSQTRITGTTEILGATNLPKYLLVPNELEYVAREAGEPFRSDEG